MSKRTRRAMLIWAILVLLLTGLAVTVRGNRLASGQTATGNAASNGIPSQSVAFPSLVIGNCVQAALGGIPSTINVPCFVQITGTTGSIGGALLAAGSCSAGTATIVGGTTGHPVSVSPSNGVDLGGGFVYRGVVTNPTTVTVQVCAMLLGTPAAVTYNVATY